MCDTQASLAGYYLYLNTTAVHSHHPVSRVFMAAREPTEATCVTFWWKGRGVPSQLNVYRFTKETAMRDPLLSLNTNDEEDWWNVRTLTIKSRRKWNLVFEVIAAVGERRDSGVMIDDVEFTDGECPPIRELAIKKYCPYAMVIPNRTGYYLLYKSAGFKGNHSTLVLRDKERYRCASLWYYLPAMADGVQLMLKDNPVGEGSGVWKRQQFQYPSGWMNAVRAVSGSNASGFVAIDDVLVNELPCDELGRSTEMFDCGNKQTVPIERLCDFVPDCRNGADERKCGQCDFSEGTCGWNLNWFRNGGTMAWRRERIAAVSGSPQIGADTRRNGHYLLLYSNITNSQLTGQAGIISPVIRNTNKLCTMRFWYNYVNNGSRTDIDLIMQMDPFTLPIWTLSALNTAPEQGIWNEVIIDIGRYTRGIRINFFYTVQGKSEPQLTLNVRTTKDGPWKTIWKQSEPTQFWHFVAATVEFSETAPYQVAFIGEHKASRQEGYIAIDDVTFAETCKTYDKGACDFSEDLCGMENEYPNARFGWNWTMAKSGEKNNVFPSTDSHLDEGGAYAAYALLNPGEA
ncbi:hypothetical protein MTO96_043965 [Rhipicephalus appendiculatus]